MSVDSVLSGVSAVISTVVNIIGDNPVLSAFIGVSLVSLGAFTFKSLISR